MNKNENLKIALVGDFLTKTGGAQNTLRALADIYRDAPIYCLLYDEVGTKKMFVGHKIIPSRLQNKPGFLRRNPKLMLGQYQKAIEEFDFSSYDIVISTNDSFAHGIITMPTTFHFCYCHTPARYLWDWHNEYLKENKIGFGLKGFYVRRALHQQRIWDRLSADRVDVFAANSHNVKKRIKKYWQRDSIVIYPPVRTKEIKLAGEKPDDYYIIISRLEPYKRIDLAIEACTVLQKKLLIIGEGSDKENLMSKAGPTVKFLGWQSNEKIFQYLSHAKAFIFPGEDDFGIAPLEASACGRPVIAFAKGGALETVLENKTGIFFDQATSESLIEAIKRLEINLNNFSAETCRAQAEKFSTKNFQDIFAKTVMTEYEKYQEKLKK